MSRKDTETVAPGEARADDLLDAGSLIADRYAVQSFLGSGGSSHVYVALDRALDQRIALKILRRERVSAAATIRMRREVAVARQITSPAVVRVFDIGETPDGTTFVTMELVEGEPLRDRIARGALSVDETLDVAKQLLAALREVHRAGVVHRDVKPANVMVQPDGRIKLTDLGLARTYDADEIRATQTEAVVGTVEYLAPEQALGKPVDSRSDLYSFGVLLFECLTGQLPFGDRTSVATILAHVRERPRDARALRRDAPRWLSLVIRKLLEKRPARRFASATEVLIAIEKRRAPVRWRLVAAISAALSVAVAAMFGVAAALTPAESFHQLVDLGPAGIRAVNADGATLWIRRDVWPDHALPVRREGKIAWVAVMPRAAEHLGPSDRGVVQLLDPITGSVSARTQLPIQAGAFPGMPDEFATAPIVATDVDRDGTDELVITFTHVYWPSYTVFYRPALNQARLILAASGHHRYFGAADVDGDGVDELLLGGINNFMGWYTGLGAISVADPAGARTVGAASLARTPDAAASPAVMKWYALLPQSYIPRTETTLSGDRRELLLEDSLGRTIRIGLDGLLPVKGSGVLPAAERLRRREAAYEGLRAADRLTSVGDLDGAIDECGKAARSADEAFEPHVAEWARRKSAKLLARAGRVEEAVRAAEAIAEQSEAPSDARFDVARELHLRGILDPAIGLYTRSLFGRRISQAGRIPYDALEGAVLALCELRRFDAAQQLCLRYASVTAQGPSVECLAAYVDLRRGVVRASLSPQQPAEADLSRAIRMEWQQATGAASQLLLDAAERELARGNSNAEMLHSVRAGALQRLGRHESAVAAARTAVTEAERQLGSSTVARAHILVLRERLESVTRAAMRAR